MPDTREYKLIVTFEDGVQATCSAVVYQGTIWLVPTWLPFPTEGYAKPERMIRLDQFRFQHFDPPVSGPPPLGGADFAVNDPLPRALFDGELSLQLTAQYIVLDKPDARFRTGGLPH